VAAKRKAVPAVPAAVEEFLAGLELEARHKPLASLTCLLAESLEAAPEYARARLAKELRDTFTQLEEAVARAEKEREQDELLRERRRRASGQQEAGRKRQERMELERLANERAERVANGR
jgi:hypothetical protein